MSNEEKIYKCKSCKEAVQKDAKKCPHCGVKHPTFTAKQGCLIYIVLSGLIGLAMYACTDSDQTSNTNQAPSATVSTPQSDSDKYYETLIQSDAVNYQIIRSENLSHATRSRNNANILAPKAQTKEQQLATAAKAAKEIQLKNRVQVSSVNLMTEDDGVVIISINYAPDQKGWAGSKNLGQRFVLD
ncbi:MAG: hypothetical protein ACRCRU_11795 [Vibrio sp.]|uniref:DUF4875 domain-containing protein n=1 Tax=Vibrio sp. TaxID=678 RepID=UPI003F38E0B5